MKILALLLLCLPAFAQPTLTTIADTVYNAVTGAPFNGQVVIQGPNVTQGGVTIFGTSFTRTITNGVFPATSLVPNDTALPSQSSYLMTFTSAGGYRDVKTCVVPTSGSPVTLQGAGCVDGTQTTPLTVVALSQIANGGATAGQILYWTGTQWAPENLSGGGNVLSSGTPTNGQFAQWINANTIQGVSFPSACSGGQVSTGFTGGSNNCVSVGTGSGTVTNVSAANLSPLFTTTVGNPTTTPSIAFSLSNAAQNSVFAGPPSGGAGAPSYQTAPTFSAANLTNFPTFNQNTTGNANTATNLASYPGLCSGGQFSQGLSSGSNNCGTPSGSGALALTSGSGAPSANCTAMSASYLAIYEDTTNQNVWFCPATNTWKLLLSTTDTGPYVITGATGTAPSAPSSGSVTCYFDSTSLTQVCLDSTGDAFTMVKGLSAAVSNNFLTYIDALGIQHYRALASGDIPNNGANTSGNAGTATALAATPSLCSSGQAPTGILPNGNATGCQALSGGGTVNYGVNSVACTSSPTFNLNSASYSVQSVSLTCSISSMSFTNLSAGALVTFRFCRTGTNQAFSGWPGAVHGGFSNAAPIASTCDSQSFYSPDGTNLYSNGPGVLNQP